MSSSDWCWCPWRSTCCALAREISTRSSVGSDRSRKGATHAASVASSTQTDLNSAAGAERLTRELTEPTDQLQARSGQQRRQVVGKDAPQDHGDRPRISLI